MKKKIAAWKNKIWKETLKREATMQDVLYLCLILWIVMPMMMLLILSAVQHLPSSLMNLSQTNRLSSAYAKYFYVLGLATVCVALAGLSRVLPEPKDLIQAARQRPWHACLAFMLFWAALSTLFSGNPISRFWGMRYQNDGLGSWMIYGAVYVCVFLLRDRKKRLALLQLLSFVGVLCSILIFKQFFIALWNGKNTYHIAKASFFNINHCAYFLTVTILCSAGLWLYEEKSWKNLWNLIFFAVQSYALVLNSTLGSFLAVVLSLPIICVLWFLSGRRGLLRPLTLCAVFLSVFGGYVIGILPGPTDGIISSLQTTQSDVITLIESPEAAMEGGSGRVTLWLGSLKRIAQHPIFGLGPDSPVMPSPESKIIRPHNEFLERAMYMGLPALAAYLGTIFSLLVYQLKRLREADAWTLAAAGAVTAYLISSFFGLTLFYTTPFFFLVLGLAAQTGADLPADGAPVPNAKDADRAAAAPKTSKKRRRLSQRDPAVKAAILLTAALYAVLTVVVYQEAGREYRDIQKMIIASAAGEEFYNEAEDFNDLAWEFWFDPQTNSLYSTDSQPPAPYGEGTRVNGKSYLTSEASSRNYDLESNYTQCVLKVYTEIKLKDDAKNKVLADGIAEGSTEPVENAAISLSDIECRVMVKWVNAADDS